MNTSPVLIVVDMQRYYVDPEANFRRFPESLNPDAFEYIATRCEKMVIPNIRKLQEYFRSRDWPIVFLRLCGQNADRSDLHYSFMRSNKRAESAGYPGIYPLADEALAGIIADVAPEPGEPVLDKVTYSGFTSSNIEEVLLELKAGELVFCGLATSQCVDTTARDAADRGYEVIQVEDAMADYREISHQAALIASQAICGGNIASTEEVLESSHPSELIYEWE